MMSSAFSIFPPIFYLFIFLSSASHHPPSFSSLLQPPLTKPIKQPVSRGNGVKEPTNIWAIGERGGKTNETAKTAGKPTTMAIKTAETVRTATETLSDRSGTGQIGEKAGTTPSGRATESEDECEDVGRNCAAMERMCGNIARRDIMTTFCRKTCNLC
ncbi:hypothetical protein GPALN_012955 [Globodera pallida]|nr:hypothetical protein GPALN_012955 [Globodera pallida]